MNDHYNTDLAIKSSGRWLLQKEVCYVSLYFVAYEIVHIADQLGWPD